MEPTRRELWTLAGPIVAGLWLPGCVAPRAGERERAEADDRDSDDAHRTVTADENASDHDERDANDERGDELDRLPERSPLAEPLPELVAASDREAVASRRGLDVRGDAVQVLVEVAPDGERPDEYLAEVTTDYRTMVVAWVAIDDLVDLALDDRVRLVRPVPPAHLHGDDRPRSGR